MFHTLFSDLGKILYKILIHNNINYLGVSWKLAQERLYFSLGVCSTSESTQFTVFLLLRPGPMTHSKTKFPSEIEEQMRHLKVLIAVLLKIQVCWMLRYVDWQILTEFRRYYIPPKRRKLFIS